MGEWLTTIRFDILTYFFKSVTFLGNIAFLYFLLPIVYWCWRKRAGFFLMILVILASYSNFLIKGFIAWERPPINLWLIGANGYAFPSTHAVLAVVIWGFLAYQVRKTWFTILSIFLVLLIAISRVYLGVHYPGDVLAGLAVGVCFLYLYRWSIVWFRPKLARVNDIVKAGTVVMISLLMLLVQPNTLIASGTGLLAGVYIGILLEPHFADFSTDGIWYHQILKIAVGLLISLAIWQGLEWVFPEEPSFRYFQFFILGNWIISGAPWLFIQLRLAKREE
jgi:membrane-associated phospholipid phosphatase